MSANSTDLNIKIYDEQTRYNVIASYDSPTPESELPVRPLFHHGLSSSLVASFDETGRRNLAPSTTIFTNARCDSMMPASTDLDAALRTSAMSMVPGLDSIYSSSLSPQNSSFLSDPWSASTGQTTPMRMSPFPDCHYQWMNVSPGFNQSPVENLTVDPNATIIHDSFPVPPLDSSPPQYSLLRASTVTATPIPVPLDHLWLENIRSPFMYPASSPISVLRSEQSPFVKPEETASLDSPKPTRTRHGRTTSDSASRGRKQAYRRRTARLDLTTHDHDHDQHPTPLRPLPSNIRLPLRKKSKEKYPCPKPGCESSFEKVEHLKRHEAIHTGVRPYSCVWHEQCNRAFGRQDNKRDHYKTHLSLAAHGKNKRCSKRFMFRIIRERESDPREAEKTVEMLEKWTAVSRIRIVADDREIDDE